MANPKHDYNSKEFYEDIYAFAFQGMTDAEIAYSLDLHPDVFGSMKNGNYAQWTKAENKKRSIQINRVLARARAKINTLVRSAYLKGALGGKKVKCVIKRFVQGRCSCDGKDDKCSDCGGTGWIQLTDKAVAQETESELPPNMQALSTWLYHHDGDWRKVERKLDEDASDVPTDIEKGIDVDSWIKDQVK